MKADRARRGERRWEQGGGDREGEGNCECFKGGFLVCARPTSLCNVGSQEVGIGSLPLGYSQHLAQCLAQRAQ